MAKGKFRYSQGMKSESSKSTAGQAESNDSGGESSVRGLRRTSNREKAEDSDPVSIATATGGRATSEDYCCSWRSDAPLVHWIVDVNEDGIALAYAATYYHPARLTNEDFEDL